MKTTNTSIPSGPQILLETLFGQATTLAILVLDNNGDITLASQGLLPILGYPPEELVGKNISMLFHTEEVTPPQSRKELEELQMLHNSLNIRYLVHKDGSLKWSMEESISITDSSGQYWTTKIIHDLQANKDLQYKVSSQREAFDSFVHKATHDLKSPVNNIEGLISIMKDMWAIGENPSPIFTMADESISKFKNLLKEIKETGLSENTAY